jgi:hypothetical protein
LLDPTVSVQYAFSPILRETRKNLNPEYESLLVYFGNTAGGFMVVLRELRLLLIL